MALAANARVGDEPRHVPIGETVGVEAAPDVTLEHSPRHTVESQHALEQARLGAAGALIRLITLHACAVEVGPVGRRDPRIRVESTRGP